MVMAGWIFMYAAPLLSGIYHFRVKYPDQDKATGEESDPQPPKPTPAPSSPAPSPPTREGGAAEQMPEKQSPATEATAGESTPDGVPPTAQDVPADNELPPASPDAHTPDHPNGRKPGPSSEERASLG